MSEGKLLYFQVSSLQSHFQSLFMKNDTVCDVAESLCRDEENTITEAQKWQRVVISK